ncbi:hypothetical protein P8C59_003700 [Phyllachora maydis]|uniref:Uncharacterized protein n=1 Tax=Phyllachora maydis TaxID=1825666 RepID=A0AAD9MCP1_9PEZI|nr:hypothetical protein P8C59_003700 [Phyllachora maydis]
MCLTGRPHGPSPPLKSAADHWPCLNPLTAYYTPDHVQAPVPFREHPPRYRMDIDMTGTQAVASPARTADGRASSVSLDDPDVRLAAEALGDLRADLQPSPNHTISMPSSPPSLMNRQEPPEPLLSLLTTSHPLLATTIEGATSAYNNSKNFSPRFKSGAEYVEGYLTPIANTVGSVGRVTGVEGDCESAGENKASHSGHDPIPSRPSSSASAAWQQRLIMSTSGLSIAMSEESLRSLKYCLRWLRWANEHVGTVIANLKTTLDRYDGPRGPREGSATPQPELSQSSSSSSSKAGHDHGVMDARHQHDHGELATRINALKNDLVKTLQGVIETVSKYAGGALPENARVLVHRHLTSLPQRFRVATMQDKSAAQQGASVNDSAAQEKEMREGAQRVLVLAKEGLDMMAQVSGVLDGTISSAEEWCDRLGRKKREEREARGGRGSRRSASPAVEPLTSVGVDMDVKMG